MREIKFRAWDKKEQRMAREVPFLMITGFGTDTLFEVKDDERLTWMQFTGLKDKNGKEIYEGDILNSDGDIGFVGWADDDAEWWFWKDNEGNGWRSLGYAVHDGLGREKLCEVIGNIYENPELLKDKSI